MKGESGEKEGGREGGGTARGQATRPAIALTLIIFCFMSILDEHERVESDEDVRPRLPFPSLPPSLPLYSVEWLSSLIN